MSFRNKGNWFFFSSKICSICWQHKLSLEFIFPICQNQPRFSLWFKSTTTCLNSLIIDTFSICHWLSCLWLMVWFFLSLFFFTVYKQKKSAWSKNLKAVQDIQPSTRENQTTQTANTCSLRNRIQHGGIHTSVTPPSFLCYRSPLSSGMETPSLSIHLTPTYFTFIITV